MKKLLTLLILIVIGVVVALVIKPKYSATLSDNDSPATSNKNPSIMAPHQNDRPTTKQSEAVNIEQAPPSQVQQSALTRSIQSVYTYHSIHGDLLKVKGFEEARDYIAEKHAVGGADFKKELWEARKILISSGIKPDRSADTGFMLLASIENAWIKMEIRDRKYDKEQIINCLMGNGDLMPINIDRYRSTVMSEWSTELTPELFELYDKETNSDVRVDLVLILLGDSQSPEVVSGIARRFDPNGEKDPNERIVAMLSRRPEVEAETFLVELSKNSDEKWSSLAIKYLKERKKMPPQPLSDRYYPSSKALSDFMDRKPWVPVKHGCLIN